MDKYGEDRIASIGTYQTMTAKAILKSVGKVMGVDYNIVNQWTNYIPSHNGKVMPLSQAVEEIPEIAEAAEEHPKLFELAIDLESMPKSKGVHASGYEVSPISLLDSLPLTMSGSDVTITQYEGEPLESLGYIKFDILGIKVLSVIEICVNLVKERHGVDIDFESMELDDRGVYEMLQSGNTQGVFQLSSEGMTNIFKELNRLDFDSLIAGIALYRPGPMKFIPDYIQRANGVKKTTYMTPELEDILSDTFGIIVYQEQAMIITQVLGGYSSGQADLFRKAIGKKSQAVMDKELPILHKSIMNNGYSQEIADNVIKLIEPFVGYGFNKSHAASYAVVSYYTAYLKHHFPLEFYTAQLTINPKKKEDVFRFIEDAKLNGITILPPDINLSKEEYTPAGDKSIYYGFAGISGVSVKSINRILETRPYESIQEMFFKTEGKGIDKRSLEALAFSGAFDNLEDTQGLNRAEIFRQIMVYRGENPEEFDEMVENFTNPKKLELEKKYLKVYLTGHPLEGIAKPLDWDTAINEEQTISSLAFINNIKRITTKKGDPMAFLELSFLDKELDAVCFPDTWEKSIKVGSGPKVPMQYLLEEGMLIRVKGKFDRRDDEVSFFFNDATVLVKHNKEFREHITDVEKKYGVMEQEKTKVEMPQMFIEDFM